ncbi:hypothetical protein E8E13_000140 [Curvularia kusanoi]|uniref:Uncharacterized protein n=1 Tax=Curvularia kusanoi TaxID=90978 RepID=A0A9P4TD99_CURKU|nr:hypothetical protein E8E13_000140 [Curvularia kusanoi]
MLPSDIYLEYFFSKFLYQNAFTGISAGFAKSLSAVLHRSSELHDAVKAIAALHIGQCNAFVVKEDYSAALKAYSRSVRSLQAKIEGEAIVSDPSVLWATFLLGVFELMRDATGVNWLAHFLHGTSTMLRLLGPDILTVSNKENAQLREFFFGTRIFELSRALIYTAPTFLSTTEWSLAIETYWIQNPALWTPKEALFDLIPKLSDLGIRACGFVAKVESMVPRKQVLCAKALAEEGLSLHEALLQWRKSLDVWMHISTNLGVPNEDSLVSSVYYAALSIYLDGIFSYHAPFISLSALMCPMLDHSVIQEHVSLILAECKQLLDRGCAGVVLLFPLRVAGARARGSSSQLEILRLLRMVAQRGFMVAQSFVEDLSDLWAKRC